MTNKPEMTMKAQEAFSRYLALGPSRSLAKLAEMYNNNTSYVRQLARWSSEYKWVERAKAHDAKVLQDELDRKVRERQAAIEAMNQRISDAGQSLQQKTLAYLLQRLDDDSLGALPAVQLYKIAIDSERQARDLPDSKVEVSGKDGGPVVIKTVWGTPKVEKRDE